MSSENIHHVHNEDSINHQSDEVDLGIDRSTDAQSELGDCKLGGFDGADVIVSSARRIHENFFASNCSIEVDQPPAQYAQYLQAAGHPHSLHLMADREHNVDWDEVVAHIYDYYDEEPDSESKLSDYDWDVYARHIAQDAVGSHNQEQRRQRRDDLVEDAYLDRMSRRRRYETWRISHLRPAKFISEARITISPKVQVLNRKFREMRCLNCSSYHCKCNYLPIAFDTRWHFAVDLSIDAPTGLHVLARFQDGRSEGLEALALAEKQTTKQGHIMQLFLIFRLSTTLTIKTVVRLFASLNEHDLQKMPPHMVQEHAWIAHIIVRSGHLSEEQRMAGLVSMERTFRHIVLYQAFDRPRVELIMLQTPADAILHASYAALKDEWHTFGMAFFRENWQDNNGTRPSRVTDILIFDPSPVATLDRAVRWGGINSFAAMFLDYVAPIRDMRCPRIWYSKDICVPLNGESSMEWTINWMYWVWMQESRPLVEKDDSRLDGFIRIFKYAGKGNAAASSTA